MRIARQESSCDIMLISHEQGATMGDLLIRNVDGHVHKELKRRAEADDLSVQQYVLRLLADHTSRPSIHEWLRRVDQLPRVDTTASGAEAVAVARAEAP
jgi:hypothetical protein